MISGKRVLALITARAGSKRLPGKNVRPFAGRPLISWSVRAAKRSRYVDSIVVSSDDQAAIQAAIDEGAEAPFVRPADLSTDAASSVNVTLHALEELEERGRTFDLLLLLQPTSPLRTATDIDKSLELAISRGMPVIGVAPPLQNPAYFYTADKTGRLTALVEKDSLLGVEVLCEIGSIFIVSVPDFKERRSFRSETMVPYVMPRERSIDIDTELEFRMAEFLFQHGGEA